MMQQCALIGRHNPSPSPPGALPQSMLVMLTQCRPKASPDAIRGLGLYPTQIAPPFLLSRHLLMQCATSTVPDRLVLRPRRTAVTFLPSGYRSCNFSHYFRLSVLGSFTFSAILRSFRDRAPSNRLRSQSPSSRSVVSANSPANIVGNRCLGETGAAKATHCLQPS